MIMCMGAAAPAEDWKGTSPTHTLTFGALAGLGLVDATGGMALRGFLSKKIVDRGFVTDVNDQVFLEAAAGPVFLTGTTALAFSAQLRWEFNKDEEYALYAVGGVGGIHTGVAYSRVNELRLYPRFGIGGLWNFADVLAIRAELAQDFIGLGVQVTF
jgi:hypothetical protein